MARKQDTTKAAKSTKAKQPKSPKIAKAATLKASASKSSAPTARARKAKSTLEAVRTPILAASTKVKSGAGKSKTKVKNEAKKAIKAAKKEARGFMADVHMPHMPEGVSDAFKSVGTQIAGALNSDVGRVLMAEMLMFVAASLTKAAAGTETGKDAKSAILSAGAKIGAVAADAGAKMVETGHDAADAGSAILETGRKAAGEGAEATASGARNLVREVAQVAVGAVGGAVVDAAQKAIGGRGRKPAAVNPAAPTTAKPDAPKRAAPRAAASKVATPKSTSRKPSASATPTRISPAPSGSSETAPAIAADAGHRPPVI